MLRISMRLALGCLLVAGVSPADDRVPMPAQSDIDKSTKVVRELFKDDYAKTSPKAKVALAEKLFMHAVESNNDRAAQYVLLREAASLAAVGGDIDLGLRAVEGIRERFRDVKQEQIESLLKPLTGRAMTTETHLALTAYLLRLIDDAVTSDDLDAATRLGKMAEITVAKARNPRLANAVTARMREIDAFKKDAAAVRAALAMLEKVRNDPDAAVVAGRYYCYQKDDWVRGLELFAIGSDAKLKAAAQKDLSEPKEPAEVLALADTWYELGTAATGPAKRAMLMRAYGFYTQAAPDLSGLNRTKVDKRLDDLEKSLEGRNPHEELWAAVRAAVRTKDYEELQPLGGFIARKPYRELAPGGGVLIGFHYTTKKFADHDVIDFVQPIYMTPMGEKAGTAYGKVPAKPLTVKAKPGYAVASLKVRGGGLFEAFSVTFMKIEGKGVKATDSYESPLMGRNITARGLPAVGDSRPVIGIHGKLNDDPDEGVCSIGLIVAGPKPKK